MCAGYYERKIITLILTLILKKKKKKKIKVKKSMPFVEKR